MFIFYIYNRVDTEGQCRDKGDFLLKTLFSFNSGKIKMEIRV